MADIKFSELPKANQSKDSDEIAILQDGVNKMIPSPVLESKIINKTVSRVINQGGASLNLINPIGVVPTYADLATITPTPELNDAYQVEADGLVYVYTENGFQAEGDGFKVQSEPNGVIEEGNTQAVSGGEVYNEFAKIDSLTLKSVNLINTSIDVISGHYIESGLSNSAVNWIRTPMKKIPSELIGQKVTVSGGGNVGAGASLVAFRNLANEVISTIPSIGGNQFPFTFTVPVLADRWGFTIANQATDGGIGTRPTNNDYTTTFQVEAGEQATNPIPLGEIYLNGDKIIYTSENANTDFNTNEIVLIKSNDTTCQLLIHAGGENDVWFKTTFFRQTNSAKFVDTWRLNEGWIVRRTGDFTFVNVKQVILTGVWENAIYTSGAGYTDALGSAHGWEELVETSIFLDGNKIDLSTITTGVKGSYFNVFQRSNFKTSDGLSNIGVSLKEWQIKNGIISIKNTINWLGTLSVSQNSYLSMLSVIRKNGDMQVTTSALSNEDMNVYDVSESGFETPIYTNETDPNRTNIVIWGDSFKASMNISKRLVKKSNGDVLFFGLPNAGMYVQNTELYNKLYGRFGSDTVVNGDTWEVETIYKISL